MLTITASAQVETAEILSVQSAVTANDALPVDDTDAAMKQMSSAAANSSSFEGLLSVEIDIADLVAEVSGGSVLLLRITNPTYAGSAISFVATLDIEYA